MRIEYIDIEPTTAENENWEKSRREFLRSIFIGSIAFSFISFPGCTIGEKQWNGMGIFTDKEMNTLYHLQLAIFPADGNGPSASELNALDYFMWNLTQANLSPNEIETLKTGLIEITKVISKSFEKDKTIDQFTNPDWANVIPQICKTYALKDWLSKLTTLLLESLLLDPVYGVNINERGWEWLGHQPGIPRPTEENKYPNYLHVIYG
jgi:gluconate 2-dehydrogenase gamma chain